ncbi:hypothetical protein GCM10011312_07050 [Planktosalinus lacus]|uniref:Secretion system C-terminal sorting domain-containing protein n=2 Tax=Planktosalinus lacus TaxID=1526573 RepID=A0A8J2V858_9FLAO|nr:hypothetical protein GCM10011312_07050 [Planktosalinus lacus]
MGSAKLIAQPANDLIENAIDLGYGPIPYDEEAVDFSNATNANDHTPGGTGCALSQPGVWYKFTATKVGVVGAGIILPDSPVIVFFEGPAEGVTSGMELFYVDQPNNTCAVGSLSSIETTPGTTYYVYMKNNVASDILINTTNAFQVPENDLIENAINLNGMEDYFEEDIHFLMATNTNDGGANGCDIGEAGIWYKFTAQIDGQVVAGISSAATEGGIIFYTAEDENATSGSDLTWFNAPNNPCAGGNITSIEAIAGNTYYVFTGMDDPYGDFSINLSQILNNSDFTIVDFNYYPNPVVEQLNFSSKTTIDHIKVYNLLGQVVLNEIINNTSGSLDMRHLTNGMYLAEVTSGDIKTTAKILKK